MKQKTSKILKGEIEVLTGLHIGAGNDKVEIGGIDGPVIRNPFTREPYIPGSSIKGKMRALLEWKEGKVLPDGEPCSCGECNICRVFGKGNAKQKKQDEDKPSQMIGPTRIIIRDAELSEKSRKIFSEEKLFSEKKPIIEEKSENNINRITAAAVPRQMERVVPGVKFNFELVYRVIDTGDNGDKDEKLFDEVVIEGLKLLQNDYLGGGGSRGNGRIKFVDLKEETTGKEYPLEDVK